VIVTGVPTTALAGFAASASVVGICVTVSATGVDCDDVDPTNPVNDATIWYVPGVNELVVTEARPRNVGADPRFSLPAVNCTVPSGVLLPGPPTNAVSVTESPAITLVAERFKDVLDSAPRATETT
jgi:hypothetical protein